MRLRVDELRVKEIKGEDWALYGLREMPHNEPQNARGGMPLRPDNIFQNVVCWRGNLVGKRGSPNDLCWAEKEYKG